MLLLMMTNQWLTPEEQDVIYSSMLVVLEHLQFEDPNPDKLKNLHRYLSKKMTREELRNIIIDLVGNNVLDT